MRLKNILLFPLIAFLATTGILYSCQQKSDGFYDFKNKENVFDGTIYEYIRSKPQVYDSLVKVIDRVGWLKDSLNNKNGKYTIFMPVNNSFTIALQNLNIVRMNTGKPLLDLGTVDISELDTLIDFYAVQGNYPTDSMQYADGVYLKSVKFQDSLHAQKILSGAQGIVNEGPISVNYAYTNGSSFVSKWVTANTQVVNIRTNNGTVYVLANSTEFGFDQFTSRMNK